ncbi:MAG: gamma-glutamylcyclotransferase family protein [Actinomycetota bacterium]|nr:gamma-glutamylcyclotransferase family protein [Actinomycetota bacterium]
MKSLPIFVYGTLKPGEKLFHHISHAIKEVVPAVIPGRLYDTPFGYPLLVNPCGEEGSLVMGVLLIPVDELYDEMMKTIDAIEGEAGFDKGVMEVTLEGGSSMRALVYYYREAPPYAQPFYSTEWP